MLRTDDLPDKIGVLYQLSYAGADYSCCVPTTSPIQSWSQRCSLYPQAIIRSSRRANGLHPGAYRLARR